MGNRGAASIPMLKCAFKPLDYVSPSFQQKSLSTGSDPCRLISSRWSKSCIRHLRTDLPILLSLPGVLANNSKRLSVFCLVELIWSI